MPEPITLETVLALAERLSAAEKLKLIEHLLVELKPIVERKAPKKRRSPTGMSEGQSLTEEEVEEIKRKLWGKHAERRPRRVVQYYQDRLPVGRNGLTMFSTRFMIWLLS